MLEAQILTLGATAEQRKTECLILLFILCEEMHGGNICLAFHLYNWGAFSWRGACVFAFHTAAPLLTKSVAQEPYPRSWAPRDVRPIMGGQEVEESQSQSGRVRKWASAVFVSVGSRVRQPVLTSHFWLAGWLWAGCWMSLSLCIVIGNIGFRKPSSHIIYV